MRTTTKEKTTPKTVGQIRERIKELAHKQMELFSNFRARLQVARVKDYNAAKGNKNLTTAAVLSGTGPEQDKVESAYYEEMARLSALKSALEWTLGERKDWKL